MKRMDRLRGWIEQLPREKIIDIAIDSIDTLIDSEYVSFPDDSVSPYWHNSGDNLDGSEEED